MQTFEYQNKIYSFIYAADFLKKPKKYLWQKYDVIKGSKYLNVGSGFDIETTRIDEHHSTMYMWQYAIGSLVIIGRKWYEFTDSIQLDMAAIENVTDESGNKGETTIYIKKQDAQIKEFLVFLLLDPKY